MEKIIDKDIYEEAEDSYVTYAMNSSTRQFATLCDGLTKVARRIIYSMNPESKDRSLIKSARVVGDVIGKYHPHGDQAVYTAMSRLNDTNLRIIEGHGNWGDIYDSTIKTADMRYTKCRLHQDFLAIFDSESYIAADFVDNYDGSKKEAYNIPTLIPLNLVNGGSGMRVGYRFCLPPHNPKEIIDLAIACINAGYKLKNQEVIKWVKGPDCRHYDGYILHDTKYEDVLKKGMQESIKSIPNIVEIEDGFLLKGFVIQTPDKTTIQKVMSKLVAISEKPEFKNIEIIKCSEKEIMIENVSSKIKDKLKTELYIKLSASNKYANSVCLQITNKDRFLSLDDDGVWQFLDLSLAENMNMFMMSRRELKLKALGIILNRLEEQISVNLFRLEFLKDRKKNMEIIEDSLKSSEVYSKLNNKYSKFSVAIIEKALNGLNFMSVMNKSESITKTVAKLKEEYDLTENKITNIDSYLKEELMKAHKYFAKMERRVKVIRP